MRKFGAVTAAARAYRPPNLGRGEDRAASLRGDSTWTVDPANIVPGTIT